MTTTLTLDQIGKMSQVSSDDRERALTYFRMGLEAYCGNLRLRGRAIESYAELAQIFLNEAELPIEYVGEGSETRLSIGNNARRVIVDNMFDLS